MKVPHPSKRDSEDPGRRREGWTRRLRNGRKQEGEVSGDNAEEHEDDEEVQEEEEYEIDPEQDQEGESEDYEFDGSHDPEDEVKEYYAEVEVDRDEQDGHGEEGYESSSENGFL